MADETIGVLWKGVVDKVYEEFKSAAKSFLSNDDWKMSDWISWKRDKTPKFYIQNKATGLVLDVKGENGTPSTRIIMWKALGQKNQTWIHKDNMLYSQLQGNLVLDADPDGYLNINVANQSDNQKWYFEGDFIKCGNGKYVTVNTKNHEPGAEHMEIITDNLREDDADQKFRQLYV